MVSGALGGLVADLASGGLTLGAGALIGGVLGALGIGGAARAYNEAGGAHDGRVRWSAEFLAQRFDAAILRYLAVALRPRAAIGSRASTRRTGGRWWRSRAVVSWPPPAAYGTSIRIGLSGRLTWARTARGTTARADAPRMKLRRVVMRVLLVAAYSTP